MVISHNFERKYCLIAYAVMSHSLKQGFFKRLLKIVSTLFVYRTDKTVIGCSGFHGDCLTLTKIIEARLKVDFNYVGLEMNMTKH